MHTHVLVLAVPRLRPVTQLTLCGELEGWTPSSLVSWRACLTGDLPLPRKIKWMLFLWLMPHRRLWMSVCSITCRVHFGCGGGEIVALPLAVILPPPPRKIHISGADMIYFAKLDKYSYSFTLSVPYFWLPPKARNFMLCPPPPTNI